MEVLNSDTLQTALDRCSEYDNYRVVFVLRTAEDVVKIAEAIRCLANRGGIPNIDNLTINQNHTARIIFKNNSTIEVLPSDLAAKYGIRHDNILYVANIDSSDKNEILESPNPRTEQTPDETPISPKELDEFLSSFVINTESKKGGQAVDKKPVCNKCGRELDAWDLQENFTIKSHLGYGTKYDGEKLDIKLCCSCMEKLIEECVVSPVTENDNT